MIIDLTRPLGGFVDIDLRRAASPQPPAVRGNPLTMPHPVIRLVAGRDTQVVVTPSGGNGGRLSWSFDPDGVFQAAIFPGDDRSIAIGVVDTAFRGNVAMTIFEDTPGFMRESTTFTIHLGSF